MPSRGPDRNLPPPTAAAPLLDWLLAALAPANRTRVKQLLRSGRVRVNGKVVTELGTKVDALRDHVEVDGKRVEAQRKYYYLLNKPKGFVTTVSDLRGVAYARPLVEQYYRSLGRSPR